jgi:hypothetical protein
MPRIALATSSKHPNLAADDRLLLAPLAKRGIQTEPAVWNSPSQDWSLFDGVILRSCWDYHLRPEEFLRWIASLEAKRIPLWNPASVVRWNANKGYLRELGAKGIAIVPTLWPEASDPVGLPEKLRELGWTKAVVKPRISATAHRTHLIALDNAESAQGLFEELRDGPGVMVQKFMESIVREGEWSLMFFGGQFSHAILKTPKAGDFRVQGDFGGNERPADPPALVEESAAVIVRSVAPTLYARVDGVVDQGQFRLMELELIEPMLFLALHPEATSRFAEAIESVLKQANM